MLVSDRERQRNLPRHFRGRGERRHDPSGRPAYPHHPSGVWFFGGVGVHRAQNPRAFRHDLWLEGTVVLLMAVMAVLMWTLPREGRFDSSNAVVVWSVAFMGWVRTWSGNRLTRKQVILGYLLLVVAVAGVSLTLQRLAP